MTYKKRFISVRSVIMTAVALSALIAGVVFAWPEYRKDFARVQFNHVSVMAEVADTPEARIQGLSGRPSLPEFGGMLFVMERPEQVGIWMKDMNFPIDILWIANGKVIDMREDVGPPAKSERTENLPVYRPITRADFVLEVAAGFSKSQGVHIGDAVNIELHGRVFAQTYLDADGIMRLTPQISSQAGSEYFIETLHRETLRGNNFVVKEKLETTASYDKYAITYDSGDLIVSGTMNVPKGISPQSGFPVLVLNHGLIPPPLYTTGRGSKREQDFFARHGYVTVHPDYRGHASSSPNVATRHDFYVGYTQDVMSLLDAIERSAPAYMDPSRIGMWGHSMGGGITARIMVLRPEVKAFVLFAPISADVEDNFYELSADEIQWLRDTYGPEGDGVYRKMSPIEYFADVSAPVQIHHGTADTAVPLSFSEKMYNVLKKDGKKVEYFLYPDEKHEFIKDWPLAAERSLQFFDRYVKSQ